LSFSIRPITEYWRMFVDWATSQCWWSTIFRARHRLSNWICGGIREIFQSRCSAKYFSPGKKVAVPADHGALSVLLVSAAPDLAANFAKGCRVKHFRDTASVHTEMTIGGRYISYG